MNNNINYNSKRWNTNSYSVAYYIFSSGCAVLSENNDLVLTKKIQPSTILEIQSDELFEMPKLNSSQLSQISNSFKDLKASGVFCLI